MRCEVVCVSCPDGQHQPLTTGSPCAALCLVYKYTCVYKSKYDHVSGIPEAAPQTKPTETKAWPLAPRTARDRDQRGSICCSVPAAKVQVRTREAHRSAEWSWHYLSGVLGRAWDTDDEDEVHRSGKWRCRRAKAVRSHAPRSAGSGSCRRCTVPSWSPECKSRSRPNPRNGLPGSPTSGAASPPHTRKM